MLNSQHYADANLIDMLSVCGINGVLCAWVWLVHTQRQTQVSLPLLLGFAIAFRLIGVFAFPVLEDDIYRFLWDGQQTVVNGSPYLQPPSDFFDSESVSDRFDDILSGINHPDIATVYGPVCQWFFALAYLISPGEIWPLQLLLALADIGVVIALIKLAKPTAVLLYAWSPLLIKEFSFTAHPDVLGVLFMVLALLAYKKDRTVLVGILMACAAGVKIFPILILPFLLGLKWRGWLSFLITAITIALPFGVVAAWLPEGLKAMSGNWFFNAPLYSAFINFAPDGYSSNAFKYLLLALLATGCGLYWLKRFTHHYKSAQPLPIPRGDLLFAAFFLCLPALNPWYLVWLLPFAVIWPSPWAWLGSAMILMSYASGINLDNSELEAYQHPHWVLNIEFGVIALAVFLTPFMKKLIRSHS